MEESTFWLRCGRLNLKMSHVKNDLLMKVIEELNRKEDRDALIAFAILTFSDEYRSETFEAMKNNEYWFELTEEIIIDPDVPPHIRYLNVKSNLDELNCLLGTFGS